MKYCTLCISNELKRSKGWLQNCLKLFRIFFKIRYWDFRLWVPKNTDMYFGSLRENRTKSTVLGSVLIDVTFLAFRICRNFRTGKSYQFLQFVHMCKLEELNKREELPHQNYATRNLSLDSNTDQYFNLMEWVGVWQQGRNSPEPVTPSDQIQEPGGPREMAKVTVFNKQTNKQDKISARILASWSN